jgi:uncharacterized protein (DUF2141 family)
MLISGLIILAGTLQAFSQSLEIEIAHIRNTRGTLHLAFYRDAESFDSDSPFYNQKIQKDEIIDGALTVKIEMDTGTYGIALLDDENNNGLMDYNLVGIPREGFGFSDYAFSCRKRPKFSDFDFHFNHEPKIIHIMVRYLL